MSTGPHPPRPPTSHYLPPPTTPYISLLTNAYLKYNCVFVLDFIKCRLIFLYNIISVFCSGLCSQNLTKLFVRLAYEYGLYF